MVAGEERQLNQDELDSQTRHRLVEQLAKSERLYRTLADNTTDVILSMEMDLTLTYVSPSVVGLTHYSVEEYEALPPAERYGPETRAAIEKAVSQDAASFGGVANSSLFEVELPRKGGGSVPVEVAAYLTRDDCGQPTGIIAVARDISERKRAEKQRVELEEKLHQSWKMESIGRLAGGIAHDFNNLLCVILGYSDMMQFNESLSDEQRGNIQQIFSAGQRAKALTQQLLMMSRKQVAHLARTDINEQIEESLKMYRRLLEEDIALHFRPAVDLPVVMADSDQLSQILANLLLNARDALNACAAERRERSIRISTAAVQVDGKLARSLGLERGPYIRIKVADTGSGMDAATQAQVFEPFFTTKSQGEGTGLGLATVYGVVGQNEGAIRLTSELGLGTTFEIFWPIIDGIEDTAESPATQEDQVVGTGSELLLLVEDEVGVLLFSLKVLTDTGYRVVAAKSAEEALELLESGTLVPDMLVSDVVMTGMDGKQLSERVLEMFPGLPVLYISGYADNIIARHGVLGDGVELIGKPFSATELQRRVRKLLDHGRSSRSC
ncbi:MAG: ATP-binding protein [bacterium]|nr:response regulator [Planctomycetota bacterium]HIL51127.1 response regulator [Planctomycetota bacterium]